MSVPLAFALPSELEAAEPPAARDGVRMLVATKSTGEVVHTTFRELPSFLTSGDLVVINTSATIPAAIRGIAADGTAVAIHLSTRLEGNVWVVEPRRPAARAGEQWHGVAPPRRIRLDGGGSVELLTHYRGSSRLWVASVTVAGDMLGWLARHGRPIRYKYVATPQPIAAYQNVYATEPGSAEMPSAGRPFTEAMVTRLVAKGVGVTPIVLHTGVASLESDELPYPERAMVPAATAQRVNATRADGGRVIAVGTTVVRALETAAAAGSDGESVVAFDGWTDLIIGPDRPPRVVDGILTGWHEPKASHLLMLEAIAGRELLNRSYQASLEARYRWHEFGDVHLVLP